ncbi:MAG: hypothetical protein GTO41_01495 [Burkholderiales bacterium]|nr:hypothetical protein [Burkholderiales bacterium]
MSVLESSILGILAVLLTGYVAKQSIESDVARIIAIAATLTAFWILVAIAAEELARWLIADTFGRNP